MSPAACRFDLNLPAVRDAITRLLERQEVQGLQLNKPAALTEPVEVGVRLHAWWLGPWWYWYAGETLLAALDRAETALGRRGEPYVEPEP